MGDVEAFAVDGIKCYFPSADHYPQHFEAYRRGKYVVRVYFLRTTRKRGLNWDYKLQMRGGHFGPADRQALYDLVMKHKRRLAREWTEKVRTDRRGTMMMPTSEVDAAGTLTVLLGEDVNPAALLPADAASSRIHLLSGCDLPGAAAARKLFVITPASRLGDLAPCISEASRHNRLQALLVRTDVDAEWVPFMLRRAGLRTLRNLLVHSDAGLPGRMLRAWALGVQRDAIAAATTWENRLLVVTCAFEEFEIGFETYPALRRIAPGERARFQVEEDGMFLEWPHARTHLTVDDLRLATDPALRARVQARRLLHDQAFGAAVRALRESRGIAQARVEGLSARHLRRIENGYVPGDEAIEALAAAHGMDSDAYLHAVSERMPVP